MEEWRDIAGYEGSYQVSSLGRVRSLDRKCWLGNRWGNMKGRVLAQPLSGKYKYRTVALGAGNTAYVHRLVLEAFVGPCPEGMEACHFPDRDPSNNRLENLRWGTHRENMDDMRKHGSLEGKMARAWNPRWAKSRGAAFNPTS